MTSKTISGEGIDLEAIQARVEKATKGPWTAVAGMGVKFGNESWEWLYADVGGYDSHGNGTANDDQFIAHARQDIPALLAEVRRLEAALIRLRGAQQEETAHEDLSRVDSFPK